MNTRLSELEDYYKKSQRGLIDTKAVSTETKTSEVPALSPEDVEDVKRCVIVSGLKKDIILGTIHYYTQGAKLFNEFRLHPETEKMMEKVAYGVEYGLPVEKELLFKTLPELFYTEIRRLKDEEQQKYLKPSLELGYINNPKMADEKKHLLHRELSHQQMLEQKIFSMKMYHWEQAREFGEYYLPYLEERAATFGYPDEASYLSDVLIMDEDKLTEVEKRMVSEARALQKIEEDIKALEIRSREVVPADLETLPFPIMDPKLREKIIRENKYIHKFCIKDLKEVFFLGLPLPLARDYPQMQGPENIH